MAPMAAAVEPGAVDESGGGGGGGFVVGGGIASLATPPVDGIAGRDAVSVIHLPFS
jgi:hypothetical protein